MNIFRSIRVNLWPYTCILCRSTSHQALDLCLNCSGDLPHIGSNISQFISSVEPLSDTQTIYSVFEYRFPINKLIHALKFRGSMTAGRVLGQLTGNYFAQQLQHSRYSTSKPDLLIPVPLHPKRQSERGYNQATLLAKYISDSTQIQIETALCQRTKYTQPQSELPKSERIDNIKDAFTVNLKQMDKIKRRFPTPHFAIVDDVITTGSTAQTLSNHLIKAGAARVDLWSVSRAL